MLQRISPKRCVFVQDLETVLNLGRYEQEGVTLLSFEVFFVIIWDCYSTFMSTMYPHTPILLISSAFILPTSSISFNADKQSSFIRHRATRVQVSNRVRHNHAARGMTTDDRTFITGSGQSQRSRPHSRLYHYPQPQLATFSSPWPPLRLEIPSQRELSDTFLGLKLWKTTYGIIIGILLKTS